MPGLCFFGLPGQAQETSFDVHAVNQLDSGRGLGHTSLVDVDRDGDLDFIVAQKRATVFWFEHQNTTEWVQHKIGEKTRADVGGVAFDVNGDGLVDQVSGRTWYRNPGNPGNETFDRFTNGVPGDTHDNRAGDINGDGKKDLVVIDDGVGVFWYQIPEDPTGKWIEHKVKGATDPTCHSGIALGDIDGDRDLDISRVDRWFENVEGDGTTWREHRNIEFGRVGPWGLGASALIRDLDGDGDQDLVQAEGDLRTGGRVAWFENSGGKGENWNRHVIQDPDQDFHSLCVADFNNDGNPDVFSGGGPLTDGTKKWYVWINQNNASSWKKQVINKGNETHEARSGDVDDDGDVDVVTKPWDAGSNASVFFIENLTGSGTRSSDQRDR